jgi:hypothetical protein
VCIGIYFFRFLLQIFPSLNTGGVAEAEPQLPTLTPEGVDMLPVYVRDVNTCNQICDEIIKSLLPDGREGGGALSEGVGAGAGGGGAASQRGGVAQVAEVCRVGFDLEWTPPDLTLVEGDGKVATVQIAYGKKSYVFHVARMLMPGSNVRTYIPPKLKELLECPFILKSGVNIANDAHHLIKLGVNMPQAAMEDIGTIAKSLGLFEKAPSLKNLGAHVLKVDMDKRPARSYWDGSKDSPLQQPLVEYAALDAWVARAVAQVLQDIKARLPHTFNSDDEVSLWDASGKRQIAYGKIISVSAPSQAGGHDTRILLSRIFVGSFKLTSSQRSEELATLGIETLSQMDAHFNNGRAQTAGFDIAWHSRNLKHRFSLDDLPTVMIPPLDPNLGSVREGEEAEFPRGQHVSTWEGERVKLDMVHFMMRTSELIPKSHGMRILFLSRWRDAIFAVNQIERKAWEANEIEKLKKANFLPVALKVKLSESYRKMIRKIPRLIPPPPELHTAMHAVFSLHGYQLDQKTGETLFSQRAWDAVSEGDKHVKKGCCSDHPAVPLYYMSPDERMFFCARGTSALEGWHRYLRSLIWGRTTISPLSAMYLVMGRIQRWNMQMGISRLGEKDYGTFDMQMLISLKKVDTILSIANSKYKEVIDLEQFADTGETFGILPHCQDIAKSSSRLTEANDDDAEAPFVDGASDFEEDSSGDEEGQSDKEEGEVLGAGFRITRAEQLYNQHSGEHLSSSFRTNRCRHPVTFC